MDTEKANNHPIRKQTAISFLTLVASGNVREACQRYAAPDFRHHNPYFKGDVESLRKGMEDNAVQFPHMALEVQHALEDGDLVAVHSRITLNSGGREIALAHIFRFRDDTIIELWDLVQPVPESSPNEHGMF